MITFIIKTEFVQLYHFYVRQTCSDEIRKIKERERGFTMNLMAVMSRQVELFKSLCRFSV